MGWAAGAAAVALAARLVGVYDVNEGVGAGAGVGLGTGSGAGNVITCAGAAAACGTNEGARAASEIGPADVVTGRGTCGEPM
jgi:hypothetical protein